MRTIDPSDSSQIVIDAGQAALWDKAEMALRLRLAKTPNNPNLLEVLGQLYRQKGELAVAAEVYGQLSRVFPSHLTATYLHAVLSGSSLPVSTPVALPWPAPFVIIQAFLPKPPHHRLLELARKHQSEFQFLKVYNRVEHGYVGKYQPKFRLQTGLKNEEVENIIHPRILEILPVILPRLQVKPFQIGNISTELSLSHDGHFGKAHRDDRNGHSKVSFAYYFHAHPKAFKGGDLLLYDTDIKNKSFDDRLFTQIKHEDNTLVVYPSVYYHQITKVTCPSDAFDRGRFAVAGHVSVSK